MVMMLMRLINPHGVEMRRRNRLQRRIYQNKVYTTRALDLTSRVRLINFQMLALFSSAYIYMYMYIPQNYVSN